MSKQAEAVLQGGHAGVFTADDVGSLAADAADQGWYVVGLDTSAVTDQARYLEVVCEAFDFPLAVGGSWDGLDACLRALDLDEPDGLLVVWDNWSEFAIADPVAFETAVAVFQDAAVAWRDDETPGAVLLHGPGPETDLPPLGAAGPAAG